MRDAPEVVVEDNGDEDPLLRVLRPHLQATRITFVPHTWEKPGVEKVLFSFLCTISPFKRLCDKLKKWQASLVCPHLHHLGCPQAYSTLGFLLICPESRLSERSPVRQSCFGLLVSLELEFLSMARELGRQDSSHNYYDPHPAT